MKNIFKVFAAFAVASLMLSSCIKETFPMTSYATAGQIGASTTALDAAMSGLPAQLCQYYPVFGSSTQFEPDMGFPMLMMAFTELMGDIYPLGENTGYDWFRNWNTNKNMGPKTNWTYIPWRALYMFVKSANDIIGSVNPEGATPAQLGYLGMGYTYRAFWYYHLMNMYEPVENEYTDVSNVLGLTVPIVSDQTAEADGKNNPRVSHEEMMAFILSDLAKAEEYLQGYTPNTKVYPNLAVAYGVHAKVAMSDGRYADAEKYARLAIETSGCTPMSQAQWEDVNTGFNTANNAWMWYTTYAAESMGNLCNWIGWISSEADWGYSSLSVPGIDRALYERISDDDFRKHSFLDPKKYDFYNYQSCRGKAWIENKPAYTAIKFRPVGGDYQTYTIGGACHVPMMRVEEMYYIEAEAKGLQSLAAGVDALNAFVKQYRQSSYDFKAATVDEFEKEILFQKKIEFWGEGIAFFDAKRMRAGTCQSYEGTNAPGEIFRLNCNGIKPNWNFVIPESELNNNVALQGKNNPDPTDAAKADQTWL